MTDDADRWTRFEAWAVKNRPAMRAQDRKRIASELFEMVGEEIVLKLDVENLQRRYRQGLLGAQAVMLVKRVGDDIVAWQTYELSGRSSGKRSDRALAPPELDEDDLEDQTSDPSSRPPPSARAWARKKPEKPNAALSAPKLPRELSRTEDKHGGEEPEADDPSRGQSHDDVDASHIELPPRRDRGEQEERELDDDAREVISRWTFEEEASPRSRQSTEPDTRPSQPMAPSRSDADPMSRSRSSEPTLSSRPDSRALAAPVSSASPDSLVSSTGSQSSPSSELGATSSTRRAPASMTRPVVSDAPRRSSLIWKIGAAILVVAVLAIVVIRSSSLFPKDEKTTGLFLSKHLDLALTFPAGWTHEGSTDESKSTGQGWERRVSRFYEGKSSKEFSNDLTVVAIAHDGAATSDDLKTFGAAELLNRSIVPRCAPLPEGREGFRCESSTMRDNRQLRVLEEYFLMGPRIVFARGFVDLASNPASAGGGSPGDSAIDTLAGVVTSIEPLDAK